jgi:glycosyltransferase involved in cell wall biosynthesis
MFAMGRMCQPEPITIFTPSAADADNTNAQNLTVKEIVSRLPEDRFRVIMFAAGDVDPRVAVRKNTKIVRYRRHGNAIALLSQCLFFRPNVYFFPRSGPLDRYFFDIRKRFQLRTSLVSYIVMMMNEFTGEGLIGRSILEADRVVANSEFVASSIRQKFGRVAKTIYDGVDLRYFFAEDRLERNELTVLYAGSFQPRKRVEVVILQAARWPSVRFRLAGHGETELSCRALAEKLGCQNIDFLGHLSPKRLGEEMRKADVFLFPSVVEGHPQVLLQAAASGLPCIAMELYHPDSIVDRKTGFLARSDAELEQKLELLLKNGALRRAMSDAAVKHSRQFDWQRVTEQWAGVFEDVVSTRARVPTQMRRS